MNHTTFSLAPTEGPSLAPFRLAGGSVPGREHLRSGKNNQDAYAWAQHGDDLAAVVADGCGSGAHSELGARLGARALTTLLARSFGSGEDPALALERARLALLDELGRLAALLGAAAPGTSNQARAEVLTAHLLFTLVGVLVLGGELLTFSLGDGVLALDGEAQALGPFPGNRPPYLAYALLAPTEDFAFRLHHRRPAAAVGHVLLGTDGAADLGRVGLDLAALPTDPRLLANPDMLRRRLTVAGRQAPGLPDDTTVVVLTRGGTP